MNFAVVEKLHAGSSLALEGQPGNQRVSENRQVGPIHIGDLIRTEYGFALAIADSHVADRSATLPFHHATVMTFKNRNPDRACSVQHGGRDRGGLRSRVDKKRSSPSTGVRVWGAMPI